MRVPGALLLVVLIVPVFFAGCTDSPAMEKGGYSVNESGILTLYCPPCQVREQTISETGCVTVRKVIFSGRDADVYTLCAVPETPRAGFVLAPGAGVKKEGHAGRAEEYARAGYAYLVLDMRGNGGETPGRPLDLEEDFGKFSRGEWPQYYLSICDIMHARSYLQEACSIPVYATGESNGGRYAAIAASLDPGFAGYIGVSTSGFGRAGDRASGDARRFLLSVDPETYVGTMPPRSTWIFHAPGDTIIPFAQGYSFYQATSGPKKFFSFNGTHGYNDEVDLQILRECTQIYDNRG